METKEIYQQIFQAFSALSDAQDLLGPGRPLLVNDVLAAQD